MPFGRCIVFLIMSFCMKLVVLVWIANNSGQKQSHVVLSGMLSHKGNNLCFKDSSA